MSTDAADLFTAIHTFVAYSVSCTVAAARTSIAASFAEAMIERGVHVIGSSDPVVPQGEARIRTQISTAHTRSELEHAVASFIAVKRELGV